MANPVVLQHCLQLMRRASEIDARHAGALNEAALTLYMMGDVAGAQQQYANAAQVDDANVEGPSTRGMRGGEGWGRAREGRGAGVEGPMCARSCTLLVLLRRSRRRERKSPFPFASFSATLPRPDNVPHSLLSLRVIVMQCVFHLPLRSALYGLIRCHIVQNNLEEAAHLVEFLSEIQSSLGSSGAEFAELQALLHWKISRDRFAAARSPRAHCSLACSSLREGGCTFAGGYLHCCSLAALHALHSLLHDLFAHSPSSSTTPSLFPCPLLAPPPSSSFSSSFQGDRYCAAGRGGRRAPAPLPRRR